MWIKSVYSLLLLSCKDLTVKYLLSNAVHLGVVTVVNPNFFSDPDPVSDPA
jgi:hypothetical protein